MSKENKFVKFSSIENSYRAAFINKVREEGKDGGEWCVTEKVDGANASFWVNSEGIKFGKRTSFINPDENGNYSFYNCGIVIDRYSEGIQKYYDSVFNIEGTTIIIYGELFGGGYKHKDVENINNVKCIQNRIQYTPNVDFIAFNVVIQVDEIRTHASVKDAMIICNLMGINFVPYLFEGTMEECLAYENTFQTKIPDMYDLPPIEDNVAEGVVIQPVEPVYLNNGSKIIIKNKNAKFAEKMKTKHREYKPPKELSQAVIDIVFNLNEYINENRLKAVISKLGTVTDKDFGKLSGLLSKDVMEDYIKDNEGVLNSLEKSDKKDVTKALGKSCAELIREHFLNIIDGEF